MEKAANTTTLHQDISSTTIRKFVDQKIRETAAANAAMAWSTPGDRIKMELEEEGKVPFIVARFGNQEAINGDPLPEDEIIDIPEGCIATDKGGRIPIVEQQVDLESVANAVARDLDIPFQQVWTEIEDEFREVLAENTNIFHTSTSGGSTIFACQPGAI